MHEYFSRLWRDWFLLGMFGAVILASFAPRIGQSGGLLHAETLSDWGIFAIFFLHGISLSTEKLKQGLLRWQVHLLVQIFTFAVFPLLWLAFDLLAGRWIPLDLMLGFFYLCALPSTISSSVAMTSAARGNVPAAIFNATLSTLLGIFLTPLLISLVASHSGGGLALGDAMLNIAKLLLLPFVLGQLLRPFFGTWFARWKPWTSVFDRAVILLLVLVSFSDSVAAGLWQRHGLGLILLTIAGAALFLVTVLLLTRLAARRLGLNVEDEIVAVFCGSKKTLASGVPMAKLLFGAHPALGVIVLPIMFYHQLQLFVCAILARRYATRAQ
ncbi:MAG: Bile acid:sodium symporter [Proteobacteria bacterium]|nr:Bile acid:sodium symporter [Pseudomonadota bacterium]